MGRLRIDVANNHGSSAAEGADLSTDLLHEAVRAIASNGVMRGISPTVNHYDVHSTPSADADDVVPRAPCVHMLTEHL
eukprot:685427-Alexandrium_andersonii.AAC.1